MSDQPSATDVLSGATADAFTRSSERVLQA